MLTLERVFPNFRPSSNQTNFFTHSCAPKRRKRWIQSDLLSGFLRNLSLRRQIEVKEHGLRCHLGPKSLGVVGETPDLALDVAGSIFSFGVGGETLADEPELWEQACAATVALSLRRKTQT